MNDIKKEAFVVEIFDKFVGANTMKQCLQYFRDLCTLIKLNPSNIRDFYPILKNKLSKSWRAQAIFKKLDLRYNLKIYGSGSCCQNTRVLVIGGGPCGLRSAIDAQLLGAKVVIVEKRDRMSRNNVLHLWPFVIEDLRHLGAKKFFGKFGAGSIDHISIRQLQLILLKVALMLGVQIIEGVCFDKLVEPDHNGQSGWRASVMPENHPLKNYEFDVLIGADGKRNTLSGFKRKEFRGKLAIAITANFINRHTKEESIVPEISGISYIYKQEFFKSLYKKFKIDLENIVYYKDSTHYFVMTAKKQSLLDRGVLKKDYAETLKLLSPDNVDNANLCSYVVDAVEYSTEGQLTNLEFAVNHYGQPDVAVFDFTSMYAAENASQVLEKHNRKLLNCLVGDSLLEPFWPTGSGCARGFLSSLDACWAIRQWGLRHPPLQVLAERESIYRLLAQTTPKNLNADLSNYTVDPATRYVALNKNLVSAAQVLHLYKNDVDDKEKLKNLNNLEKLPAKEFKEEPFRPIPNLQKKDRTIYDNIIDKEILMRFFEVPDLNESLHNGIAFCKLIEKYRPYIINPQQADSESDKTISIAMEVFDMLGIPRAIDNTTLFTEGRGEEIQIYLSNIYNYFKGEIPIIPHSLDSSQYLDSGKSALDYPAFEGRYDSKKFTDRKTIRLKNTLKRKSGSQRDSSQIFSSASTLDDSIFDSQLDTRKNKIKKRSLKRSIGATNRKDLFLLKVPTVDNIRKLFEIVKASSRIIENDDEQKKTFKLCQKILEAQKMFLKSECMLSNDDDDTQQKTQMNVTSGSPEIASKIKHLEQILNARTDKAVEQIDIRQSNKKPADLMRAIGTIDVSDWQIQRLEKEIINTKPGTSKDSKEKVPKWDKSQFIERKRKIVTQNNEEDKRFAKLDDSLKKLDNQLKHGDTLNIGERGKNKVSQLASQFKVKEKPSETTTPQPKLSPKPVSVHPQREACHVCDDHVYLTEKIRPEDGLVLHKKCFKCSFCTVPLNLRNYMFDRDGHYNFKLFCTHHYGMERGGVFEEIETCARKQTDVLDNISTDGEAHDRDNTPERVEVIIGNENLEESLPIDEDEWHNQNFGSIDETSYDEISSEEDDSSSELDSSDSDDFDDEEEDDEDAEVDEMYAPSPETSYKDSSGEEEAEIASGAWGPALEERRREVALKDPPPSPTPTDTEAETESTSKNSEAENSATEVSTDSEFAQDEPTPTREKFVGFNSHNTKSTKTIENPNPFIEYRNKHIAIENYDKYNQVKATEDKQNIKTEFKPLFTTINRPIVINRPGDYLLSRTQSTSGIATKKALELKKKYLLGPQMNSALQKSDSASELDSKFKEFHSTISECQKLLNPASDISPSMQAFLDNASRRNNAGGLLSPNNNPKTSVVGIEVNQFSVTPIVMKSPNSEETSLKIQQSNLAQSSNTSPKTETSGSESATLNEAKNDMIFKTDINSTPLSKVKVDKILVNSPQSPVLKIDVPEIPWQNIKKNYDPSGTDIDSDSLYSIESSSDDLSNQQHTQSNISVPRVEIMKPCGEVMQLDSLMLIDGEYIGPESDDELGQQTTVKCNFPKDKETDIKLNLNQPLSSSDSGNDITAFFTDNESLDWAVEGHSNDALSFNNRKPVQGDMRKQYKFEINDESEHVCGKENEKKPVTNILERDHSDIEFMDTGSEESLLENDDSLIIKVNDVVNTGFVEFVDINVDAYNKVDDSNGSVTEAINEHCASNKNYKDIFKDNKQSANSAIEQPLNQNNDSQMNSELNNETEVQYIEIETQQPEKYKEDSLNTYLDRFDNNEPEESPCISADNSRNNINNNETNLSSLDSNELKEMKKTCKSPRTLRKLEEISKEKEKQKDLIYQLVMDKMSKRSERKERRCRSPAYSKDENQADNRVISKSPEIEIPKIESQKDSSVETTPSLKDKKASSLSYTTSFKLLSFDSPKQVYPNNSEAFSLPDIHQSVKEENIMSHINKLKNLDRKIGKDQSADNAFEMSYNYQTGIVPGFRHLSLNDFSGKLVQHVESLRNTSKDKDSNQSQGPYTNICVSDPNFFSLDSNKKSKTREGERRKSIIKTVSDFFSRKRDSPGNPYQSDDRRSKISQAYKLKSKSQSCFNLDRSVSPEPTQNSPTEIPPPIPPLPVNYSNNEHGYQYSGNELLGIRSSVLPQPRKRCKSLNELQYKLNENEQTIPKLDLSNLNEKQKRSNADIHSSNCMCLNKYSENLKRQRNSQSLHEHEMFLQQRHEELRLQLRELYNAGNDINHERESAIINEMMAIVAERQAICSTKNQRKA